MSKSTISKGPLQYLLKAAEQSSEVSKPIKTQPFINHYPG